MNGERRQNMTVAASLLVLMIFFAALYHYISRSIEQYSTARLTSLTRHSAALLDDWLEGMAAAAQLAADLAQTHVETERLFSTLVWLAANAKLDFHSAMQIDGLGIVLFDRHGVWNISADTPHYEQWDAILANAPFRLEMAGPLPPLHGNEQEVIFTHALIGLHGERFGAFAVRVPLSSVAAKLRSIGLLEAGGRRFFLTDAKGGILLPPPPGDRLAAILDDPNIPKLLKESFPPSELLPHYALDGEPYVAARAGVDSTGWRLYLLSPSAYEIRVRPVLMGAFGVACFGLCVFICLLNYHSRKHGQYKDLSRRDHLTGIGNRLGFEYDLEMLKKKENYPVCLIVMDVDGLKIINDTFGHKAGDSLLRRVTRLLQNSLRENDTIYRIGGDEFAVLIPGATYHIAQTLVERINTQAALMREKTNLPPIYISQGLAEASDSASLASLFINADKAMYYNKNMRRNVARRAIDKWIAEHRDAPDQNDRRHS